MVTSAQVGKSSGWTPNSIDTITWPSIAAAVQGVHRRYPSGRPKRSLFKFVPPAQLALRSLRNDEIVNKFRAELDGDRPPLA